MSQASSRINNSEQINLESAAGGNEENGGSSERGPKRGKEKVVDFIEKGEQILQNFQKTMAELSAQSKKMTSVANVVEHLQSEMEGMKSNMFSKGQSTSTNGQTHISSDNTNVDIDDTDESDSIPRQAKSKRPAEEAEDANCQGTNKRRNTSNYHESSDDDDDEDDENLDDLLSSQIQPEAQESDILQELEDLFEDKEVTGAPVSERLSKVVNKSMRTQMEDKQLKDLREKHRRPVNTEHLQTPGVEPFIWRDLPTSTKAVDVKMQRAVTDMSACLVPIIRALDIIQKAPNYDRDQVKELVGDSFKMMVHSISATNKARKDRLLKDIQPAYKSTCARSKTSATQLFGDTLKEDIKVVGEKTPHITSYSMKKGSFLGRRQAPLHNRGHQTAYYKKPQMYNRNQYQPRTQGFQQKKAQQTTARHHKK